MNRKSIIAFIGATFIAASLSLVGCGNVSRPKTGNNITNNMQDGINNSRSYTQNAAESVRDAAGNSLKYTAQNFKDDITKAGYTVTDWANNTKNYFKGRETDYRLGGDTVRLYEYNTASDLENDINKISPNGMTINGTDAKFTAKPYYYRKGNTLIVYEGKEPAYIDEFNRTYGNTLRP